MAFQPINFAAIEPAGNPAARNLISNLMQGYQAGLTPQIMQRQAEKEQLSNAFQRLQNKYYPEQQRLEAALKNAQTKEALQRASQPFGGNLSGVAKEAYGIKILENQLGPNDPTVQKARQLFDLKISQGDVLNQYRQSLIDTSGKRAATGIGKLLQEQEDVSQGFLPGTNRGTTLSPEQQQTLSNLFGLKIQKDTSDADARSKALFASNIDKTLDSINVSDLTRYAGIPGQISLKGQKLAAGLGRESKDYDAFKVNLAKANTLAKQVRQFYGDSIQPSVVEKLESITSPASWNNNPNLAAQEFNSLKDLLKLETSTYRGALKGTREYEGNRKSDSDPLGLR